MLAKTNSFANTKTHTHISKRLIIKQKHVWVTFHTDSTWKNSHKAYTYYWYFWGKNNNSPITKATFD